MAASKDERLQILRMLEEGKISATEANKLLDAVGEETKASSNTKRNKILRIAVSRRGEPQINVALPIELARVALRFVPARTRESIPDIASVVDMLERGMTGKIVDIEEDDERVRVELMLE